MANDTLLQSGRFTADGNPKTLLLREDPDWVRVHNFTQAGNTATPGRVIESFWQRGMADDTGIALNKSDAADTLETAAFLAGGFTLVDSGDSPLGVIDATISAVSAAAPPVVTVTSTAALRSNDIVRMTNIVGAQQLGGIDFSIAVLNGTTFALAYMSQIVAGTTGSFQLIKYDPIFYPRRRFISSISQASQAVVELTVAHGYTVGQVVRFVVPRAYGMKEMNNLTGTVTAVTTDLGAATNSITVDINTSGFTAFAFPLTAAVPFTQAQVIPVGEAADDRYPDTLDDGIINSSFIGLKLAAGATSPAGLTGDLIYWQSGKSDLVNNE